MVGLPFNHLSSSRRGQSGALGLVLLTAMVLVVVGLGALAVDLSHVQAVQGELQNATDAAALAGAQAMVSDPSNADADATAVASENTADGRAVAQGSGCNVNVTVLPVDSMGDTSVEVDASMTVHHALARIFGRLQDSVGARSTAVYYPSVTTLYANQVFPIAPSLDDTSQGPALNTKHVGDQVTIAIKPSGGNAAWTSGTTVHPSTTVLREIVNIALGLAPPNSSLSPEMTANGTNQIALTQGLHNGVDLSGGQYPGRLEGKPYIVMPVITGSNPYVQSRELRGFIAVHVTGISRGPDSLTLTGTLVKGLVQGAGGLLPGAGASDPNNVLPELSAATVKLAPTN